MGRKKLWLEYIRDKHPHDQALFGTAGAIAAELCSEVSKYFLGKQFQFMGTKKFEELGNTSEMNRVYWREMLFRVYWVSALNLLRHQRWQVGCIRAFQAPANLLSFATSLRGMVEASLDASYSLMPVPYTLAENRKMIECALSGNLRELLAIEELEGRLIHFVYGRRVPKTDRIATPRSHVALEPWEYRNAAGLPETDRENFRELYDELCGLCHPTAFSLTFLWKEQLGRHSTTVHITAGSDDSRIKALIQKFREAIQFALNLSVGASALCLKTLNWFSLPEVAFPSIERWSFDDIPAWRKVHEKFSKSLVN